MDGQTLEESAEDGGDGIGDDIDSYCVPSYLESGVAQRHDSSVEKKKRAFDGQVTRGVGQLDGNGHLAERISLFVTSKRVSSTHIYDFDHAVHSNCQGMLSGAIVNAWNWYQYHSRTWCLEKVVLRIVSAYSPKAKLYQESQRSACFQCDTFSP